MRRRSIAHLTNRNLKLRPLTDEEKLKHGILSFYTILGLFLNNELRATLNLNDLFDQDGNRFRESD